MSSNRIRLKRIGQTDVFSEEGYENQVAIDLEGLLNRQDALLRLYENAIQKNDVTSMGKLRNEITKQNASVQQYWETNKDIMEKKDLIESIENEIAQSNDRFITLTNKKNDHVEQHVSFQDERTATEPVQRKTEDSAQRRATEPAQRKETEDPAPRKAIEEPAQRKATEPAPRRATEPAKVASRPFEGMRRRATTLSGRVKKSLPSKETMMQRKRSSTQVISNQLGKILNKVKSFRSSSHEQNAKDSVSLAADLNAYKVPPGEKKTNIVAFLKDFEDDIKRFKEAFPARKAQPLAMIDAKMEELNRIGSYVATMNQLKSQVLHGKGTETEKQSKIIDLNSKIKDAFEGAVDFVAVTKQLTTLNHELIKIDEKRSAIAEFQAGSNEPKSEILTEVDKLVGKNEDIFKTIIEDASKSASHPQSAADNEDKPNVDDEEHPRLK